MGSSVREATFLNLLDKVIVLEKGGKVKGEEVFRKLLTEYFFKVECGEKKILNMIKILELPAFITGCESLIDIDIPQFDAYVNGTVPIDSLAGKILLSKQCLQIFHRDYPPELVKMPTDVRFELVDAVQKRNAQMVYAFHKMHEDIDSDKSRTVLSLIALILKNIHLRNGFHYSRLDRPAEDIIQGIFSTAQKVYSCAPDQNSEISDDKHIKSLIKEFCIIRKNSELSEIASEFKKEFERFKTRAEFAGKH
jgi:hypothetical protein